jgi:hypothetical protein
MEIYYLKFNFLVIWILCLNPCNLFLFQHVTKPLVYKFQTHFLKKQKWSALFLFKSEYNSFFKNPKQKLETKEKENRKKIKE